MKIVISANAEAFDQETDTPIEDPLRLTKLNRLAYAEDLCSEYLSESLYEIGIIGGQIELLVDPGEQTLKVLTSYHAPRKLKKKEIQQLVDETTAQWSDGIGEGGFQHADDLGIEVDISPLDAKPNVEQFDDGVVVKKPRKNELVAMLGNRPVDEDAAIDLVRRGADINQKDRYGKSVLDLACRALLPNLVELLLERGVLNDTEKPSDALGTLAFSYGPDETLETSVRIAKQLVERGVDCDAPNDDGATPLMMAANRNNLPLVKFLLSVDADINGQDADEHNQMTVLMYAQHLEMVKYLLENGADPNIRTAYEMNAYEVQLMNSHQDNFKEMAEEIKRHLK